MQLSRLMRTTLRAPRRCARRVLRPAVMMDVEDELGTVSKGKKADIIAVDGDVLEYINLLQNVDLVMKGGVVYKQGGQPVEGNL